MVTRWYRAPELMLSPDGLYTAAVDVWSAGCVLAELLGRRPLFAGKTYQDVVRMQIEVLGTRPADEINYIRSTEAVAYLRALPLSSRKPWRDLFPSCSHRCAAVLDALLAWHPASRATAASAMQMAFFDSVRSSYADIGCSVKYIRCMANSLPDKASMGLAGRFSLASPPARHQRMESGYVHIGP